MFTWDSSYMRNAKGISFANTDYIVSSLRQQMAAAGCRLQEERDKARIIVEPRVGALGTDSHEVTYGVPQIGQISTAAAAFTNTPVVPAIPEVSFGRTNEQIGIAKILLFAYDRETKVAVWQSGLNRSETSSRSSWVLGAGPFQKGTVHEGYRFAGRKIGKHPTAKYDEEQILASIDPPVEKLPEKTANAASESENSASLVR